MLFRSTGHDGSLSTGHANSSQDMIKRLETMVLMGMDLPMAAIRSQIASGIDILIHLGRLRDRSRKVLYIHEVDGIKDGEIMLNPLYRYLEQGQNQQGRITGVWEKTGTLQNTEKLKRAGLY